MISARSFAQWLLPQKIEEYASRLLSWYREQLELRDCEYLKLNAKLRNKHLGKRCFVLCTGPSLGKENLGLLKHELCIGVSQIYKHPDYSNVAPQYHCLPNMAPVHRESTTISYFEEMYRATLNSTLIFGSAQKKLIEQFSLFPNREIYYLKMQGECSLCRDEIPNLTRIVPAVQSVPIMCLIVAIFMGCKEIYLLGTDHDWIWSRKYTYFFDLKAADILTPTSEVDSNGKCLTPLVQEFESALRLWNQYLWIKQIADAKNVKIVNLAQGSALDVFPRDTLTNVLKT